MRVPSLLAALALLAAPLPALAQSTPDGERLVNLGRQAFNAGNFTEAARLLWDASLADPAVRDSAPLQTLRGRAVMRTGRPENAIRIFDLIGGAPEDYADAMYWRGEALLMMTEPGEAADSFREALAFDPDHAAAQRRLSELPAGITAPRAVEAPLIEAAPTEIIAAAPAAPARERGPEDSAPVPPPAPTQPPAQLPAQSDGAPTVLRPPPPAAPAAPDIEAPEETRDEAQAEAARVTLAALETPAPEPEPDAPGPEAPPAPAPAPDYVPEPEPGSVLVERTPQEAETAAATFRELAAERREAGNRAGEARALSELYLTQLATEDEIARYAALTGAAPSADIGRDFQIAFLAGIAHHRDLSLALYGAVEEAGVLEPRQLAVLRANLATAQLEWGEPEDALATAETALEADEDYANAWAVRSLAKQEMGDMGGALTDAVRAYERGVTAPPVLALLQAAGFAVNVPPQAAAPPPANGNGDGGLRGSLD